MACSPATTNNSQASVAMLSANQTAPTGRCRAATCNANPSLLVASLAMEALRTQQPCPRCACAAPSYLQAWQAALTSSCSCWPHPPSHASCWEVRQAIVPELEATQLPA